MEPYRSQGRPCPKCPGASLREFQHRYVCDECQGILIGFDDFTSAVADLASTEQKLEYRDDKPTEIPCPLCERALIACRLELTAGRTFKLRNDFLRCEDHGLWCGEGVLASVFAKVGRRWGGGTGFETAPSGTKTTGLDGLPLRSYSPATAGLRISHWHERNRRRAKTLSPINAYADRRLACPVCPASALVFQGDRWTCATCLGAFLQEAALVGIVDEMIDKPWELPPPVGSAGPRACPVCTQPMTIETTESVTLDRCASRHGLWFDAGELVTALEHAGGLHDGGVRAWIKKLFFTS